MDVCPKAGMTRGSAWALDPAAPTYVSIPRTSHTDQGHPSHTPLVPLMLLLTALVPLIDRVTAEKRFKMLGKLCFFELFTQLSRIDDSSKNRGKRSDAKFS